MFELADDQSFTFALRRQSAWISLIPITKTSAVRPGEVNRITVIAQGSHFTFLINEQYVTEVEDDRIKQGFTGIAIEMSSGDSATFEFDNFEVRSL